MNHRQQIFIEEVAKGKSPQQAATVAGFSPSYARKSSRLLRVPLIARAIAAIRQKGCEMAAYGLAEAMKEAEAVCDFAIKHKNAMAYCKGTELRAKLAGLLIDRIEITPIDLRGALLAAQTRVLNVTPGARAELGTAADLAAAGGASWETRIPGPPPGD